ncbi:MAG TPA: hypothetical protein VGK01_08175 [Candidatus Angelobacter sp.]
MTAKQEAKSLLEKLPDNCSMEDIQYHLYALEKVRSGLTMRARMAPSRRKTLNHALANG